MRCRKEERIKAWIHLFKQLKARSLLTATWLSFLRVCLRCFCTFWFCCFRFLVLLFGFSYHSRYLLQTRRSKNQSNRFRTILWNKKDHRSTIPVIRQQNNSAANNQRSEILLNSKHPGHTLCSIELNKTILKNPLCQLWFKTLRKITCLNLTWETIWMIGWIYLFFIGKSVLFGHFLTAVRMDLDDAAVWLCRPLELPLNLEASAAKPFTPLLLLVLLGLIVFEVELAFVNVFDTLSSV